jgi:hypothetical protein
MYFNVNNFFNGNLLIFKKRFVDRIFFNRFNRKIVIGIGKRAIISSLRIVYLFYTSSDKTNPKRKTPNIGLNERNSNERNENTLEGSRNFQKIASLNCKNINANHEYISELIQEHNIVFLQETWARNDENFSAFNKQCKIYHKSAMREDYTVGRPYGGIAWIVSENVKKHVNSKVHI